MAGGDTKIWQNNDIPVKNNEIGFHVKILNIINIINICYFLIRDTQ